MQISIHALNADSVRALHARHTIVLGGKGEFLGRIGCHAAPDEAGEVEIGYFVLESARGRGIAGRAVDRFLVWLQDNGVTKLRATVRPDNDASINILRDAASSRLGRKSTLRTAWNWSLSGR